MLETLVKETDAKVAKEQALVLWFDEVGIADIPLVGGKNASLGEMIRQLIPKELTFLMDLLPPLTLTDTLLNLRD